MTSAWLSDQTILITGGGSGLGLAQVRRFLDEGANVAVLERSAERCELLRAEQPDVLVIAGDATSLSDNHRAVAACVDTFGALDAVVANTGIWDFCIPLDELPDDDRCGEAFDELFRTNVLSYLLVAKAAAGPLRNSRGSLVLTSSQAGFHPGGGGVLYVASKHAVVGLVRQLAYELAPDIRVNGVAPGGLRSALRGPAALGKSGALVTDLPLAALSFELSPMQILPDASDYTGVYTMLLSRENAAMITGEVIECDGGERVRGRRATMFARARIAESDASSPN